MLLMVQKGIIGGQCHSIYRYEKANNKHMKDYDENKELSCLKYWDVNNLYSWAMSQSFQVNNFDWIYDTSQFNEHFIKKQWRRKWWRRCCWSWCSIFWKNYMNFITIYHFYLKECRLKKSKILQLINMIKLNML